MSRLLVVRRLSKPRSSMSPLCHCRKVMCACHVLVPLLSCAGRDGFGEVRGPCDQDGLAGAAAAFPGGQPPPASSFTALGDRRALVDGALRVMLTPVNLARVRLAPLSRSAALSCAPHGRLHGGLTFGFRVYLGAEHDRDAVR